MKPAKKSFRSTFLAVLVTLCAGWHSVLHAQNSEGINLNARLNIIGNLYKVDISFEVDRLTRADKPTGLYLIHQLLTADSSQLAPADTVLLNKENTLKVNSTFYHNLVINPINPSFVRLSLTVKDFIGDKSLTRQFNFSTSRPNVPFGIKNFTNPSLGNYMMTSDSLVFNAPTAIPLYIYYFDSEFDAAAPPMVTDFRPSNARLRVSKRINFAANDTVAFAKEGLYFVQADTVGSDGIGIRAFEGNFPKYRSLERLTETMVYISTNSETNSLSTAVDKRSVFDNFWLNLGGTVSNAKKMIRVYFQRVAYSNQNFTNYKAGWKTDQGMVYIVFGEPDNIIYSANSERWEYFSSPNSTKATFDFFKKKNTFSGFHFELARKEDLKKSWYDAVKRWREGEVRQ